jgi:hypothetical protein
LIFGANHDSFAAGEAWRVMISSMFAGVTARPGV